MRFDILTTLATTLALTSAAPPRLSYHNARSVEHGLSDASSLYHVSSQSTELDIRSLQSSDIEKRGGRGGRGGGGGSSGGGKGSYSPSTGSTGPNGRPASSYSYTSSSNLGGRTTSGSGPPPPYPGLRYAGGSTVPYSSGSKSPTRGVTPYLIGGGIGGAAAYYYGRPWFYPYPIYVYPYYGYPGYTWYGNGRNHTANVTCLCQEYSVCGCDPINGRNETENAALKIQLTNNGTGDEPRNSSTVSVVDFGGGNITAFINGTLPNGTTAGGGTAPSSDEQVGSALRLAVSNGGYVVMVGLVGLLVTMT